MNENLRGWFFDRKFKNLKGVNISSISNTFCKTSRRTYQLFRGVDFGTSKEMAFGAAIHSVVEHAFSEIIKSSQSGNSALVGLSRLKHEEKLTEMLFKENQLQLISDLSSSENEYSATLSNTISQMRDIVSLEIERYESLKDENKLRIADLERYVSGEPFNLGTGKIDAILIHENAIGIADLKTGRPWKDNVDAKIQITIYSLMLEKETGRDVNWGLIVFPFKRDESGKRMIRDTPLKIFFSINDGLRNQAINRLVEVDELLESGLPPKICSLCRSEDLCLLEVE